MDRQNHAPTTDPIEAANSVPTCADALRGLAVLLARAEARRLAAKTPANADHAPAKETKS
ncbi:MAG: hypothetical protein ACU0CO_03715 [Shimia sp.]